MATPPPPPPPPPVGPDEIEAELEVVVLLDRSELLPVEGPPRTLAKREPAGVCRAEANWYCCCECGCDIEDVMEAAGDGLPADDEDEVEMKLSLVAAGCSGSPLLLVVGSRWRALWLVAIGET